MFWSRPSAGNAFFIHVSRRTGLGSTYRSLIFSDMARSMLALHQSLFQLVADSPKVGLFADIPFFINRELEDRKRRAQFGGPRMLPSADDYKQHQVAQGLVPATADGGLYHRVFIEEYMHTGTGFSTRQTFADPIIWHGAPFGAFRRAFALLGSPCVGEISDIVVRQLTLLKDLYYCHSEAGEFFLNDDDLTRNSIPRGPYYVSHPSSSDTGPRAPAMPNQSTALAPSQYAPMETEPTLNLNSYILSPQNTANGAIERYRPMIELSNALC